VKCWQLAEDVRRRPRFPCEVTSGRTRGFGIAFSIRPLVWRRRAELRASDGVISALNSVDVGSRHPISWPPPGWLCLLVLLRGAGRRPSSPARPRAASAVAGGDPRRRARPGTARKRALSRAALHSPPSAPPSFTPTRPSDASIASSRDRQHFAFNLLRHLGVAAGDGSSAGAQPLRPVITDGRYCQEGARRTARPRPHCGEALRRRDPTRR